VVTLERTRDKAVKFMVSLTFAIDRLTNFKMFCKHYISLSAAVPIMQASSKKEKATISGLILSMSF